MAEMTTTFGLSVPSFANIVEGGKWTMPTDFTSESGPFIIDEIRVKKAKGMELTECPYITFPHETIPNSTTLEYRYYPTTTETGTSPDTMQLFNHDMGLAIAPDREVTASPAFQLRYSGRVANATSTARITY